MKLPLHNNVEHEYDPLSALNTRVTTLTESIIEEDVERQDEVPEVEEQYRHERWLATA